MRMPRLRKYMRKSRLLYPLSPDTRFGRNRGRLPWRRRMAPFSRSCSATVMSCCCPGVSKKVTNFPIPSARTCSFVLNPPRLRPKASVSGSLFLPQQHVDGLARWLSRRSGSPSPHFRRNPPAPAHLSRCDPTHQLFASVENGCKRSSTFHIARVSLAKEPLFLGPTRCRLEPYGDRVPDGPYEVFEKVRTDTIVPIVHWISRLGFPWRQVYRLISEFAYRP
jgi:hypothetical protein